MESARDTVDSEFEHAVVIWMVAEGCDPVLWCQGILYLVVKPKATGVIGVSVAESTSDLSAVSHRVAALLEIENAVEYKSLVVTPLRARAREYGPLLRVKLTALFACIVRQKECLNVNFAPPSKAKSLVAGLVLARAVAAILLVAALLAVALAPIATRR